MEKIWTKNDIVALLEKNDRAVARGVVAIFNRQTADEQSAERTEHHNGIGFNGVDAKFMSSLAKQFTDRGFLTPKQTAMARKAIKKYAGQLTAIANGEI